ncbi:ATP-binding cassette domain-containing protein [Sporolactobacillus putidus]|uniref:ABC transporter ATP-binding protein n=1 Tax=Sporolactobacillus putidus TaxID=492735 RepID=A0A917S9N3_9BACL|nr:AAA family ATPase [Sporolactobacillus putidus]GGL64619.1 ABC transporter ATP-binding protein [Sporolactobacillus putidus]
MIIRDMNIDFTPNKLNVIIGKNGAGKTTFFDLLSGLLKTRGGIIKNVPHQNDIVYQTQTSNLFGSLLGSDLKRFLFGTSNNGYSPIDEENMSSNELSLLRRLLPLKISKMSGGEKRWLLIYLLTHLNKKLFIFDEPLSGIDPIERINILNMLDTLSHKKNTLVLMSTHDLLELQHIDCNIYLLFQGSFIFSGSYGDFVKYFDNKNANLAFKYFVSK